MLGFRDVYGDLASLREPWDAPVLVVANHVCAWDTGVAGLVATPVIRSADLTLGGVLKGEPCPTHRSAFCSSIIRWVAT